MVFRRAISLRIQRSRSGSSSGSVALRKLRRKRSSSSSAIFADTSSADISRMSLARRMFLAGIRMRLLTHDELGLHRHLGRGKRHRLLRDIEGHTLELEHHATRLHHRHPHFRRALSLAHAGFGGLLRDRLIWEDADPHLSTTLDVTGQRYTGGFDLAAGDPARLERLETERPERHRVAGVRQTVHPTLELLAELDA